MTTTPPSTDRPPDDPRLALLRALHTPPYDLAAGRTGSSLGEAVQLIDAYRAAVLRGVAEEILGIDAHPNASGHHSDIYKALAHRFRRQAELLDATEATDG